MNKKLLKKILTWLICGLLSLFLIHEGIDDYKKINASRSGEWVIGTVLKEGSCKRKKDTQKLLFISFNNKRYSVFFACDKQLQEGDFVHLKYSAKFDALANPEHNYVLDLILSVFFGLMYIVVAIIISERIEKERPILR
jgi:hypothetical protein